jgi:hypothetical protein
MDAVFINYRREETAGEARARFNDLVAKLGEGSVFMDVDNIALGRDFREVIQQHLASLKLMLALIGRNWVNATDQSGRRRLHDPSDFVRLEIEAALKRNIPVTPVLVQGAHMPSVEDLPESLRDFAYRNGFEISHNRWESDVHEMIKRLGLGVSQGEGSSGKQTAAGASLPKSGARAESPLTDSRVGDAGLTIAPPPRRARWPLFVGAIALATGGLLYHENASQEKVRAEQAEKDRLAAAQAAQAAQKAAAQAEMERAAAVTQAEKDRLAAQRAAAQAERDRLAAVQAEKDRFAAAQQAERAAQAARPVALNGIWRDTTGTVYAVEQNGNNLTFVGSIPGRGIVGAGRGVINARNVVLHIPFKAASAVRLC